MSSQQIVGIALVIVYRTRNVQLSIILERVKTGLNKQAIKAATVNGMAMHNFYCRSVSHVVLKERVLTHATNLRINVTVNPGIDRKDSHFVR